MYYGSIEDRVQAGLAFIDRDRPGKADGIDLGRLDVSDARNCVLAQVYGTPGNGFRGWVSGLVAVEKAGLNAADLGFTSYDVVSYEDEYPEFENEDEEYEALTEEWRRAISERRAAATA